MFDIETQLYYLQSRYYDPAKGRFLNADAFVSTGQGFTGNNMFVYCGNNAVSYYDPSGNLRSYNVMLTDSGMNSQVGAQLAIKQMKEQSLANAILGKEIADDIKNYDLRNQSEAVVLASNYFSSYKGVPVIRTNGERSGSFGVIFLTHETNNRSNPEDVLRHEYGHTKQLVQLGVVNYALCIGLPSWQEWGVGEYYSKPFEITADIYGGVQSRKHSQSNISKGFAYLVGSKILGPLIWVFIQ